MDTGVGLVTEIGKVEDMDRSAASGTAPGLDLDRSGTPDTPGTADTIGGIAGTDRGAAEVATATGGASSAARATPGGKGSSGEAGSAAVRAEAASGWSVAHCATSSWTCSRTGPSTDT